MRLSVPISSPMPPDAEPPLHQLIRAHGAYVGRTLRYLGVGEADLDDVCQEVFLVVHRRLGDFEGRSRIETWLYGICVRVAAAHRRAAYRRRESLVPEPPPAHVEATQHETVERNQTRETLIRLLDRLDEDKRAVFVLYEVEQLPMPEIAKALGCPLQTAYYRLHSARKTVRQGLKQMELGR